MRANSFEQLPNIEKVLKHFNVVDQVIPNKVSVADVNLASFYMQMHDPALNGAAALATAPTLVKVVEKLQQDEKTAKFIADATKVPFFPF
jgi:hypothetical protein